MYQRSQGALLGDREAEAASLPPAALDVDTLPLELVLRKRERGDARASIETRKALRAAAVAVARACGVPLATSSATSGFMHVERRKAGTFSAVIPGGIGAGQLAVIPGAHLGTFETPEQAALAVALAVGLPTEARTLNNLLGKMPERGQRTDDQIDALSEGIYRFILAARREQPRALQATQAIIDEHAWPRPWW